MTPAIVVYTTTEHKQDAERIAAALLEQRLAACIQVSGPIQSHYHWKGKMETGAEWLCSIKTTAQAYDRVETRIRELHAYEEPEIIAIPIVAGSQSYLDWVVDNVEAK